MPFFPASLNDFLERGGVVLFVVMAAAFLMWALILERVFYFRLSHKGVADEAIEKWNQRVDHSSHYAHWIRDMLISQVRTEASRYTILLKAVVALTPLLGLLGTVTGMVQVFDLMALTGSSDAKAMSAGVSKATIPTMAGMVVSISGLLATMDLDRTVRREVAKVEDKMEIKSAQSS